MIDHILEEDRRVPRKQRHAAKRIYKRLRVEYGFDGGYTIVKGHVRKHHRRTREIFVPLFPRRARPSANRDRTVNSLSLCSCNLAPLPVIRLPVIMSSPVRGYSATAARLPGVIDSSGAYNRGR